MWVTLSAGTIGQKTRRCRQVILLILITTGGTVTAKQNNRNEELYNQNPTIALKFFAGLFGFTSSHSDYSTVDSDEGGKLNRSFPIGRDELGVNDEQGHSKRAIHLSCYSCMSSEFEKYWHVLRSMYNQPRNFSDLCLDMPRRSRIGTQQCDSACLTVLERRYSGGTLVSGRPSGYNVIRGCLSSVYKSYMGNNPKLLSLRRKTATSRRSMCEDMDARDLLPQSMRQTLDNDRTGVRNSNSNSPFRASLCTCYGELCNNQPLSATVTARSTPRWFAFYCFFFLLCQFVNIGIV